MNAVQSQKRWVAVCRVVLAACAASLLAWSDWSHAAERKSDPQDSTASLVRQAQEREIAGQAGREQLLQAALAESPDYAAAHWQSGHVQQGKQWLPYDEVARSADEQATLAEYQERRENAPATTAGQLALADWCGKHNLADQERAHLAHVIEFEPNHTLARARLGFVRVANRWLSRSEIAAARRRDIDARQALAKWKLPLASIQLGLDSRDTLAQKKARERLLAIHDSLAVAPLEMMLSSHNDDAARAVVETLAGMSAPEASIGLARHAMYAPWYSTGEFAAQKLRDRDLHSFVPLLLAALYTPAEAKQNVLESNAFRLLFRYSIAREGQDHKELAVLDRSYGIQLIWQGGLPGDVLGGTPVVSTRSADTAFVAAQELKARNAVETFALDKAVELHNDATKELNDRICRVLSVATGESLPAEPQAWWNWWNDYNEVYYEDPKPTVQVYQTRQMNLPVHIYRRRCSCLVAGTEVWTESGPRAIETIQTGDRVLAQHPDTGELAYRAVLRPTNRAAAPLVTIELPGQTIRSTGGHPFWVAGQGWVMARDLKADMKMHSPAGAVSIVSVGEAAPEPTFNLIVADFHSYFVGPDKVLSHDNTVRQPTRGGLPGLMSP